MTVEISNTNIRIKELTCIKCRNIIKLPIIENKTFGIEEPVVPPYEIKDTIIADMAKDMKRSSEAIQSITERANNLQNRCNKYDKVLQEWGMFHADKNLLELLRKINRGEFDKE